MLQILVSYALISRVHFQAPSSQLALSQTLFLSFRSLTRDQSMHLKVRQASRHRALHLRFSGLFLCSNDSTPLEWHGFYP